MIIFNKIIILFDLFWFLDWSKEENLTFSDGVGETGDMNWSNRN